MTKRRVKIDIPIRQPDKLIELSEAIFKKSKSEKTNGIDIDFKLLYNNAVKAKQNRIKSKETYQKSKQILQESNTFLGLAKGQTKATKGTVYSVILQIRDHLKTIYKGKEEHLKLWGFEVDIFQVRSLRKVKIHIPVSNADQLIVLSESIYSRHCKDTSILKGFDLKDFYSKSQNAKLKRAEAKQLNEYCDKLIEDSNLMLGIGYGQTKESEGTVFNQVNMVLKELLNLYKDSEEKLSEWGFKTTVVTSSFPIKGSGTSTKKIIAITNQKPLITLHIIFKGSNNKKIYVSWGDGTADKISLIGHTTPNSIYHDYLEPGEYEIQISGDISKLSYFKINGNQIVSVDFPKNLKNLASVNLKNNMIDSNKIINDFLSNLDSAGVFNGELDTSGGTNARPTSYGNIARNNLAGRGWEIITN